MNHWFRLGEIQQREGLINLRLDLEIMNGQAPGLSLQHELLKREMNQQLVRYHVPAQMQVSAPQARVHEDLRFRGPGGIEAGGVSRRVKSEISEPTAPKNK